MKKGLVAVLATVVGAAAGAGAVDRVRSQEKAKISATCDKHLALYLLMNQWVRLKQDHKSIAEYLEGKGYKNIAIYGMNYVGETLLHELEGSSVKVAYGIDKKADAMYSDVDIISPDDTFETVDAVIVTPITFFDEIEELVSGKVDCPILSIEDIVEELS